MDKFQKFIRKIDPKLSARVRAVLTAIQKDDLQRLDIKPLRGHPGVFRCRVGDVRIVFAKESGGQNTFLDIDFRGNIYKK